MAILPWGKVFEEFLDPLGMSLREFQTSVSGGWLFNYVRALESVGIKSSIVVFSAEARHPYSTMHSATGAEFCVIPAPWRLRTALRLQSRNTAAPVENGLPGPTTGKHAIGPRGVLRDVANYAVLPMIPLMRALRSTGCDAVLCQEYEYPRFDSVVLAGRLLNLPVFATFQGGEAYGGALVAPARRWAIRRSAGLIIGSDVEARRVEAKYGLPPERIGRIGNPIALEEVPPVERASSRAELGIPDSARVVVWHGRVSARTKGLDLLVEAFRSVAAAEPARDTRLLLIGSGDDDDWLRRLAAPEIASGVVIWIDRYVRDRALLFRHLQAGDVYVFPSRHEGFPVAPLEAMACGLPVVAARANGVQEILEQEEAHGGITVPVEDPAALARAVRTLLDDEARARALGAAALRRVHSHFSIDAVGAQLGTWLVERQATAVNS